MNRIELSSAFEIGHKKIDDEYAKLVDMLNRMHEAVTFDGKAIPICQWLEFVAKLEDHFASEERIKTKYHYPRVDIDRVKSDQLIDKVRKVVTQSHSKEDWERYIVDTMHSIIKFILRYDLMFAEHLQGIGLDEEAALQQHVG